MNEPTDQQIIEILAKREGWILVDKWYGFHPKHPETPLLIPNYLSSLDALAPILATLTEEEWSRFGKLASEDADKIFLPFAKFYLTMQPRQIALCIYKVIGCGE